MLLYDADRAAQTFNVIRSTSTIASTCHANTGCKHEGLEAAQSVNAIDHDQHRNTERHVRDQDGKEDRH